MTLYARQQKIHRCKEQSFELGEGEGGMIWENSIETCIVTYVKQITSPGSMHETGCSGLVHWDDSEGWDGEGGSGWGTHVHPWLIHVNVWWKPLQYYKVISLQLKLLKKEVIILNGNSCSVIQKESKLLKNSLISYVAYQTGVLYPNYLSPTLPAQCQRSHTLDLSRLTWQVPVVQYWHQ